MPPKQGRRKRKNAHAINEEEQVARVEHTHGEVMPRRTGENDADEPPAVRARVETVSQPKWTLDSTVREVLLHDVNILETPKLNDFLRNNVGGRGVVDSNENVTMKAFAIKPDMYIQDEKLRNHITALPTYKKLEVANNLNEVANNLEKAEVYYLRQWNKFKNKESILSMARGILNAALNAAKRQAHVSQDTTSVGVEGVYESVYDATWHYVEGVGGEGFGMQVKEGHPPQPWEYDEVMRGSAEDDNDNDNEKPESGRLELMVLTSKIGWPYRGFNMCCGHDIYVNKEVVRAWYTILKDLDGCFLDNVHANKVLTRRVLIGTPGIGKSFAAGSFLLYKLLHYDAERLPVVAYFIRGGAYLFEKNSDGEKVTWYEHDRVAVSVVRGLSKHKRGYIIYDVSEQHPKPPDPLPPPGWGMTVISSPNEKQYKGWRKQEGAYRIVMNCPTLNNIKAVCAWEKRNQPNGLEGYWKIIKGRIDNVGPLPRHIFSESMYIDWCREVEKALNLISESNFHEYKDILMEKGEWKTQSPSHKLVKLCRDGIPGPDDSKNVAMTVALRNEMIFRVLQVLRSSILSALSTDKGGSNASKFEKLGVEAFTDEDFVAELGKELKILFRTTGGREGQPSILQQKDPVAYAGNGWVSFPSDTNGAKRNIEYNKLYEPAASDFPLVDGFYFVKSGEGRVTLIGLQATIAERHDTTVTAVSKFIKYFKTCFFDWADVSKKVSWEILYVQPYETDESKQIRRWQRCKLNKSRKPTEEQKVVAKFWNEKVNQYQVNLSPIMAVRLIQALIVIYPTKK